jgi:hypothetical protein
MKRPGKKDIKAAVDALKSPKDGQNGGQFETNTNPGQLSEKKSSTRIRKQGV